jgi:predicted nucleotidyltransferase component of viral defense system
VRPEVDPFLADISRVALTVAGRHGFALGGGNALLLHGVVDRPTVDVDLFTDREEAVRAAADAVVEALTDAGFTVAEVPVETDLGDVIPGLDDFIIEIDVSHHERAARLSLAGQSRARTPITMEVGPVMHLDDLIAWKVAAIINRREVRDYIDTAAFLADHETADLIAMARRVDPGLEDDDVVMVGRVLDRTPDEAFARYGLTGDAVTALRARFAAWPG